MPNLLGDVHFFDCSEIFELAGDLFAPICDGLSDDRMMFLPAENTWLEWLDDGVRTGVLLQAATSEGGVRYAKITYFAPDFSIGMGYLDLSVCRYLTPTGDVLVANDHLIRKALALRIYALIAIINTPALMGRRVHFPHAGLQREIRKRFPNVKQHPLRVWTELKLKVALNPKDASGLAPAEVWLTGQKCLHFCRAHLRIRHGKLEIVKGHWRGDAALGKKQTRYKMVVA